MRPTLRDIECLAALLELGSAKSAAAHVGLSQPAMSHALGRLRLAFSDPLFVRQGTGLRPTPRALDLKERLADVSAALERLAASEPFDPVKLKRTFRIAAVDYLQARLAAKLSDRFRDAPGVRLAVVPLETDADIFDNGRNDIVVTLGHAASPNHRIRRIADDNYVALLRVGHRLADQGIDLESYASASHVLVSPRGHTMRASVDDLLARAGLSRDIKLAVSSFWTAAFLVARSDLVTIVPSRFAAVCSPIFGVVARPLPFALEPIALSMIWEEAQHADIRHEWLRRLVVEAFAD